MARLATKRPRARNADDDIIPKAVLSRQIAGILRDRQLTQTEAAYMIHDAPSQISLVVTGKTRGFSGERLLRMLSRLGRDIDIVTRPAKAKTGKVRVVVKK